MRSMVKRKIKKTRTLKKSILFKSGRISTTVDELFERVFWKSQLLANEAYIFWKEIRDSEEGVSVKKWKEWVELRNLSTGQYYNMIKGLRGAGFIERREGRYYISSKFLREIEQMARIYSSISEMKILI